MTHHYSSLWEYLEDTGVLEHGSDADIQKAKRDYRRIYHRQYRRKQRRLKPEITISFSKQELVNLQKGAKQHNRSLRTYLKKAALAYIHRTYLVPNNNQIARIEQLLSLTYSEIIKLIDQTGKGIGSKRALYRGLLQKIEDLERSLSQILRHPGTLEEVVRKAIAKNPVFKAQLSTWLQDNK